MRLSIHFFFLLLYCTVCIPFACCYYFYSSLFSSSSRLCSDMKLITQLYVHIKGTLGLDKMAVHIVMDYTRKENCTLNIENVYRWVNGMHIFTLDLSAVSSGYLPFWRGNKEKLFCAYQGLMTSTLWWWFSDDFWMSLFSGWLNYNKSLCLCNTVISAMLQY